MTRQSVHWAAHADRSRLHGGRSGRRRCRASASAPLHRGHGAAGEIAATASVSGLPVPRFVSLKSDRVNVRAGPTRISDVAWVYTRAGLPVEITAEFENWRRIRDWEGAEGWVYHSLLSGQAHRAGRRPGQGRRTRAALREARMPKRAMAAQAAAGVLGSVKHCDGTGAGSAGEGFDGWIEQDRAWGVYPEREASK